MLLGRSIKTVLCGLVTASMFGLAGCEELMEAQERDRETREEVALWEAEGHVCMIFVGSDGYATGGYACSKPGSYYGVGHGTGVTAEIKLTNAFDMTNATYTAVSSNESVAEASVSGDVLTVALKGTGTATVEVTAYGDEGEETQTFKFEVPDSDGRVQA